MSVLPFPYLSRPLFGLLLAAALACIAGPAAAGIPEGWGDRHVLINPETPQQAAARGPAAQAAVLAKAQRDPRFAKAVARKQAYLNATLGGAFTPEQMAWAARVPALEVAAKASKDPKPPKHGKPGSSPVERDWNWILGGATGGGKPGTFPAKYGFDPSATPSCANDYVVFPTGASGVDNSGTSATRGGKFSNAPTAGQTVTITRTGAPPLVLTASSTVNTGLNFQFPTSGTNGAKATTSALNLAAAIQRNGAPIGITASVVSGTGTVTVSALSGGSSAPITLADGLTNFSWAGASLTGGSGTAGQPTIVAFNQLYSSCAPATVPSVMWSYNTGAGAVADLSPTISMDGTQVVFIQRTGTTASLIVLKWSSASPGTAYAPTTPSSVAAASYRACTAPCMASIALSGSGNDTYSSPFYDYNYDVLFVGDDSGVLHKFTGIFKGTPTEVTTAPWPVTVSTGNRLASPVYDITNGYVFVGSDFNSGSVTAGGRLHSVDMSGNVLSTVQLARTATTQDNSTPQGVRDAPIVDGSAKRVYVFVESTIDPLDCSSAECKKVYQFTIPLTAGASWNTYAEVGRGQKWYKSLYAGAFDNTYFASADATNPSGNLYVCGSESTGASSQQPTLWKIPISNNAMGSPVAGPKLVAGSPSTGTFTSDCAPVSEVMNGANEYLFVSTPQSLTDPGNNGTPSLTGCAAGGSCTISVFKLTGATWNSSLAATATLSADGGTSGIIVDNFSATSGSQVYFSTLGAPALLWQTGVGSAIQASQAGLQ